MGKIEWRAVPSYEGRYEVSSDGQVRSLPRDYKYGTIISETPLKPDVKNGYKRVTLFKNGKRNKVFVHRLVAEAFIPNPTNLPHINHKDENPSNNNVENLMWCTPKENCNWGTRNTKISQAVSKPVEQIGKDDTVIKVWDSMSKAAEFLHLNLSEISVCTRHQNRTSGGYKWRYANGQNRMA